jgi:hypothetical protein
MTTPNPITPPPELVQQWANDSVPMKADAMAKDWEIAFASRAARWGADQELEACCEWLASKTTSERKIPELRAARRPKPPSLKEQALEQLREVNAMLQFQTTGGETSAIRRAIEALPDD